MGYRWVEHTAEVELEIEARTTESVFTDALHALAELIGDGSQGEPVSRDVAIAGQETALLLVRWLDELVYRAETEDLVPDDVERLELDGGGLRAAVRSHRGSPRHVVKGVTYHRLTFEPTDDGFRATLVLDV